jgi:hypothetical protein
MTAAAKTVYTTVNGPRSTKRSMATESPDPSPRGVTGIERVATSLRPELAARRRVTAIELRGARPHRRNRPAAELRGHG